MEQQNICKSSQLTRARALELGVPFTVPPAPSLTGTWCTPSGDVYVNDDFRTGIIAVGGDDSFRYETDINEAIVGAGGKRAVLEDGGYALRWNTDTVWTRRDEDVLCFTTRDHFTGLVPQLEADLKKDRKAAKKRMAQAEEAGDSALQAYCNNLQNSVKVLMNSAYGSYGAKVGSMFPEGFKLAAAITATGRGWLCTAKRIIESTMWVASDHRWGIGDKPDDASYVRIVYGDTVRYHGAFLYLAHDVSHFFYRIPCSATFLVCLCSLLRLLATPFQSTSANTCCLTRISWNLRNCTTHSCFTRRRCTRE
jgi:hypothetical protein